MLNGIVFVTFAFLAVGARLFVRNRTNFPRVGRPGLFGYVWTVFRSVFDSNGVVDEGCKQFGGKPFVFPSLSGEVVVIGRENVDLLRKSDDTVFNAPLYSEKLFQVKVMFGDIISNPYHLETILRSDLTKALTSLVPEVLEETQMALPEILKMKDAGSATVPLFNTMVHLVARVSNRAMIGTPGCRNEEFLRRQVSLAEQVIPISQVLNWFPQFMKPTVYKSFSLLLGSKKEVVRLVTPFVKSRIQYAQQENPQTITDILIKYAPEDELIHPERLAVRIVHLNIASIHTTGIFLTHALFELARLSPHHIEDVRAEVTAAIKAEGGVCNKAAVGKFHRLDSLLKEIGRFHPLFAIGSSRLTLREAVITDGTVIPQGTVVAIAPKVLHHNPQVYDEPEIFGPFRFSKLRQLREDGSSDAKHAFTTLSNDYVLFGIGKHACPGRFFAALEIKVILAEILLNYDLSFPLGTEKTPRLFAFNLFTVPNPTAKLAFTRRT